MISSKAMLTGFQHSKIPCINPSLTTLKDFLVTGRPADRQQFFRLADCAGRAGAVSLHLDIFDTEDVNTGKEPGNMDLYDHKLVSEILKNSDMPVDVHTMVDPRTVGGIKGFTDYLAAFAGEGASFVSFHWKALDNAGYHPAAALPMIDAIKTANPDTCVGTVFYPEERTDTILFPSEVKGAVDFSMFMTVFPGAGGRPYTKLGVRNMMFADCLHFDDGTRGPLGSVVAVDGGISPSTIGEVTAFGGKWLVVGSKWFGSQKDGFKDLAGMQAAYDELIEAAEEHRGQDIMVR